MTDYKDTLNLPKTAFPMRANLAQREPQMLEEWARNDVYGAIRRASRARAPDRRLWILRGCNPRA